MVSNSTLDQKLNSGLYKELTSKLRGKKTPITDYKEVIHKYYGNNSIELEKRDETFSKVNQFFSDICEILEEQKKGLNGSKLNKKDELLNEVTLLKNKVGIIQDMIKNGEEDRGEIEKIEEIEENNVYNMDASKMYNSAFGGKKRKTIKSKKSKKRKTNRRRR